MPLHQRRRKIYEPARVHRRGERSSLVKEAKPKIPLSKHQKNLIWAGSVAAGCIALTSLIIALVKYGDRQVNRNYYEEQANAERLASVRVQEAQIKFEKVPAPQIEIVKSTNRIQAVEDSGIITAKDDPIRDRIAASLKAITENIRVTEGPKYKQYLEENVKAGKKNEVARLKIPIKGKVGRDGKEYELEFLLVSGIGLDPSSKDGIAVQSFILIPQSTEKAIMDAAGGNNRVADSMKKLGADMALQALALKIKAKQANDGTLPKP